MVAIKKSFENSVIKDFRNIITIIIIIAIVSSVAAIILLNK